MTIYVETCILLAGDFVLGKYCVIDFRMRKVEKEYIKSLGYELIENRFNLNVYDEISSHVDIYFVKAGQVIFAAPEKADMPFTAQICTTSVGENYPDNVAYNVCIMGKYAIHNFKYTDPIVKMYLTKNGYTLINVEQGYAKCSIAVIDEKSCITSDLGIAKALLDFGIDVLYVDEKDIKLKRRINKLFVEDSKMSFENSPMSGFIGGALVRLGQQMILFGDTSKLSNGNKIKKYIEGKGLELHCFKDLEVVDYGSVIEVEN